VALGDVTADSYLREKKKGSSRHQRTQCDRNYQTKNRFPTNKGKGKTTPLVKPKTKEKQDAKWAIATRKGGKEKKNI